jgi:hypothetical protein
LQDRTVLFLRVRVDESVARRNVLACEPVEGMAPGNAGPGCGNYQPARRRRPISRLRHIRSGRVHTEFLLHLFDVFGVIDPIFTESARGTNIACYCNTPDGNSPEFDVVSRSEGPYFSRDTDDFLLIALWTFHMLFHAAPFMAQEPGPWVCWTNKRYTSKFFTFFACVWMNRLRGGTLGPISMSKVRSEAAASSMVT